MVGVVLLLTGKDRVVDVFGVVVVWEEKRLVAGAVVAVAVMPAVALLVLG